MIERPFYLVAVQFLDRGGSLAEFVTGPMFKFHEYQSPEACAKAATEYGVKLLTGESLLHTSDSVKQITGVSLEKRSYGETTSVPPDSELGSLRDQIADLVWLVPSLQKELRDAHHDTLADCERLLALTEPFRANWSPGIRDEWSQYSAKVADLRAARDALKG